MAASLLQDDTHTTHFLRNRQASDDRHSRRGRSWRLRYPTSDTCLPESLVAIARGKTPDPIPNSAVKTLSADGTAPQGAEE
jgi:hypothetical protein